MSDRSAGRLAIELPYVMPDKKTVYITDDGTNTMLGAYVAKEAGELSCGSLYAAKFIQLDAANGVNCFDCPPITYYYYCYNTLVPVEGHCKLVESQAVLIKSSTLCCSMYFACESCISSFRRDFRH